MDVIEKVSGFFLTHSTPIILQAPGKIMHYLLPVTY